jgi:hypothetical protein
VELGRGGYKVRRGEWGGGSGDERGAAGVGEVIGEAQRAREAQSECAGGRHREDRSGVSRHRRS